MITYGLFRLAERPALSETKEKVHYSSFTGVFNERRKVDGKYIDDPHFLDFVIWDKAADYVCEKFDKGDLIYVSSATPRQRKWTDDDGNKRSRIVFRINNFTKVSSPNRDPELITAETSET